MLLRKNISSFCLVLIPIVLFLASCGGGVNTGHVLNFGYTPMSLHIINQSPYYTLKGYYHWGGAEHVNFELSPGEELKVSRNPQQYGVYGKYESFVGAPEGSWITVNTAHPNPNEDYDYVRLDTDWLVMNRSGYTISFVMLDSQDWILGYAKKQVGGEKYFLPVGKGFKIAQIEADNGDPAYMYTFTTEVNEEGRCAWIYCTAVPRPIDTVRMEIWGGTASQAGIPYIAVNVIDNQTGAMEVWSVWGGPHRSRHVYQKIGWYGIKATCQVQMPDGSWETVDVHRITGSRENYTIYPQRASGPE